VIDLKLTNEPKEKLALIADLIKRGHPVNVSDNTGLTPLHEAANWGLPKVARILLQEGANVDAETNQNMEFEIAESGIGSCEGRITPLQDVTGSLVGEEMEIILKKIELIGVLLQFKPNVLKRNKNGKTPLQVLSESISEIIRAYKDVTDDHKNVFNSCKKNLSILTEKQSRDQRVKPGSNAAASNFTRCQITPGVSMFAKKNSPVKKSGPKMYAEAVEVAPGRNRPGARINKILDLDKQDFGETKKTPPLKNWLNRRTERRGDAFSSKRVLAERSDSDQETENRENMSKRRKTAFIVSDDEEDFLPEPAFPPKKSSSSTATSSKSSVKSGDTVESENGESVQKVRFTILYESNLKKQKFRITECPQRQLAHFFKKIEAEISRREGKTHQCPEITVFIKTDDGNIELTPSDNSKYFLEIFLWPFL